MSLLENATVAACLTPPAAGGVAVIQIVGPGAAELVNNILHARRPVTLRAMNEAELRLCQVVDGGEIIDDALVSVRRAGSTARPIEIIDLSLHGGARIVQRVLLLLQRSGVQIVEPHALLENAVPAAGRIERDAVRLLLKARTRPVAHWLLRTKDRLAAELKGILETLDSRKAAEARTRISGLLAAAPLARYVVDGLRIVLLGAPNVGKSTLANVLAAREHAVVSDTPGTTRDFVEVPAAISGLPVTLVDTAGVRSSNDPIEQEAIRRTVQQLGSADLILELFEAASAGDDQHRNPVAGRDADGLAPRLVIYTKADMTQEVIPEHLPPSALLISAHIGRGLDTLRKRILEHFGLTGWPAVLAPFTPEQAQDLAAASAALDARPPDTAAARNRLITLLI